jgi:hypothetical protein
MVENMSRDEVIKVRLLKSLSCALDKKLEVGAILPATRSKFMGAPTYVIETEVDGKVVISREHAEVVE